MLIDFIAGKYSDFFKVASIIEAIQHEQKSNHLIEFRLINAGYPYVKYLGTDSLGLVGLPKPDINLDAGTGTDATQTATLMMRYEKVLLNELAPDMLILCGDSNAVTACALAARKKGDIIICHLDAGLRSHNNKLPDEINNIVADTLADYFFTSSHSANENLRKAGIYDERIFFTGNLWADILLKYDGHYKAPPVWAKLKLQSHSYFLAVIRRPEHTEPVRLKSILVPLIKASQGMPVIFPVYPETKKQIEQIGIKAHNLFFIDFLEYFNFIYLLHEAKLVVTDVTGIQEQATLLNKPCITPGADIKQQETLLHGTNEMTGTNPENIVACLGRLYRNEWKKGIIPYLWDGNATGRIMMALKSFSQHMLK